MTDTDGKLIVLSGPSGAGKTSVVQELKADPRVEFSVSATTRPIRDDERDGIDYHFLPREEFDRRRAAGEFLEWAEYNGNRYGTLRAPMRDALRRGRHYVLEIEVQGTRQLRDSKAEGIYVFIVPPSLAELRRRLVKRGQNTPEEIEERLTIAQREIEAEPMYDHVVVNDVLETTVAEVRGIIGL